VGRSRAPAAQGVEKQGPPNGDGGGKRHQSGAGEPKWFKSLSSIGMGQKKRKKAEKDESGEGPARQEKTRGINKKLILGKAGLKSNKSAWKRTGKLGRGHRTVEETRTFNISTKKNTTEPQPYSANTVFRGTNDPEYRSDALPKEPKPQMR